MGLLGNAVISPAALRTVVIEDGAGSTFTGIVVDDIVVFDAKPEDVKIGKTFAGEDGVLEGIDTKTYRTTHATCLILPGESFSIPLEKYDRYNYTQFQAMISVFNTTALDSVAIEKISIYDSVLNVNSNDVVSSVTKNASSKSIDLNFINDTDNVYIVNYNTYKEE